MSDEINKTAQDERNKPISAWGYFLRDLLYAIPIVGFIIALINALDHRNINVKNHARSKFVFILIWFILVIVHFGFIFSLFAFAKYL